MAKPGFALLLGSDCASELQRRRLAKSLFEQPKSLAVSGMGMLIMAAACWKHTGSSWYMAWGASGVSILLARLSLGICFREYASQLSPEAWARLFVAEAVASACVVGAGLSLTVLLGHDLVAILYMRA